MNYWIIHNGLKLGPMSLEQVRAMNLSPETPVWRTGMPDWATACDFPELADTLAIPHIPPTPAPLAATPCEPMPEQVRPMPSSYLAWSIVATILCCIPFGIVAIYYASKVESRYISGNIDGAYRASDNAQLWIIVSISAGLVALPFQMLFSLI